MNNETTLLTTKQAASFLSLAPQTLAKMRLEKSTLPFIKMGRSVRYALNDLQEWIERSKRHSTSDNSVI